MPGWTVKPRQPWQSPANVKPLMPCPSLLIAWASDRICAYVVGGSSGLSPTYVAGGQVCLVGQLVDVRRQVHERALARERRRVDVVEPDHVRRVAGPDRGGERRDVVVDRRERELDLEVLVGGVELADQLLGKGLGD